MPGRYLYVMTSLALDSAAIATAVERAIAGDELAFARLVGAYHLDLVRVAYVVCGDEGLAEDAAQAAWWIAWLKLPARRPRTSAGAVRPERSSTGDHDEGEKEDPDEDHEGRP